MNAIPQPLLTTGISFLVAYAVLTALLRSPWRNRWLDRPNERSLHHGSIPRIGGLAIAAGFAAAASVPWAGAPSPLRAVWAGYLALAGLSWIDDVRTLPPLPRLAGHLAVAAGWAVALGFEGWPVVFAAVAIGWSANLFNFMDGSDGLAGGMATIGFGALAVGFALAGDDAAAGASSAIAAAALAFLAFNAPPARAFMGDSGSVPLGFAASALGLYGWHTGAWSLAFPLIVFMPFWFDASVTLAWRIRRGERPWQAHRDHFYQKAVRLGMGHRGVAHRAWVLMVLCAAVGLASRTGSESIRGLILFAACCVHATLALLVERRFRHSNLP